MSEQEKSPKKKRAKSRSRSWWAKKIAECERSGKSMVEYAKENKLSLSSMYSWKTALRKDEKKKPAAAPLTFVEVAAPQATRESSVEFVSPQGWRVRLPSQIDAETAARFLTLIGAQQ